MMPRIFFPALCLRSLFLYLVSFLVSFHGYVTDIFSHHTFLFSNVTSYVLCRTKILSMLLLASSRSTMSLLPGSLLFGFSARLLLAWPKSAFAWLLSLSPIEIMPRNCSILLHQLSSLTVANSVPILLSPCTVSPLSLHRLILIDVLFLKDSCSYCVAVCLHVAFQHCCFFVSPGAPCIIFRRRSVL